MSTLEPRLPFKRLGEYEVLAPIAEGGMATLWLGRSTGHPEQLVALKVIRPEHARNKDFVAMFRDEAQIASRLAHPNIIAVHAVGHDGKRQFLAMEVLRGRSLLDVWKLAQTRQKRIPYPTLAWIGARIADALHYAHELRDDQGAPRNVVHRDVNPANIFIGHDGVPKLIDFGLAKARDRLSSTAIGVVKGKLAYLAPEQAHGHPADRRADIYALGITLWELSLDRRLFREDSDVETVRRVREGNVPDPATLAVDYPAALRDAVLRALARDPDQRWQTAAELRDALDASAGGSPERIDAGSVRALLSELSGEETPADWERLVAEADAGPERFRVWDDERQKLTWMHASVETAVPAANETQGARVAELAPTTLREKLEGALSQRLSALDARADPVAVARALLEHALVDEILGEGANAAKHARASFAASPTGVASSALRRLAHDRGAPRGLVEHLDAEIAASVSDDCRASLLAERARVLAACSEPPAVLRAAWERVLAVRPPDPAALRGLEGALAAEPHALEALVAHLGRMADAYLAEPRLAAWIHVERARLLDDRLTQPDAAKAALGRALELDGRLGPVRAACVTHAVVHRDADWLVALLSQEAGLEGDAERAAQLLLEAAVVARHRMGDPERAVQLLEDAAGRASAAPLLRRRILDDLVVLHEAAERVRDALRVRQARLETQEDPRARAHEQRAIAVLHESLGEHPQAIVAIEAALHETPDDATLAEELDRLLEIESLTDHRIALWSRQAAATQEPAERARRLVRAARLAESAGDGGGAVAHLRAALVARPGDEEAVDGLLRLLTSPPAPEAVAEARARIAVHAHGAEHAADAARRVAHLEAIALLEEEMVADAARAATTYEAILRLEPGNRGALLGLARTAARAGNAGALARALLEEAKAAGTPAISDDLRVRAATVFASVDADRALALARDVLTRTPGHVEARALEQSLHESAGRWSQVDAALASRLEHVADDRARVDLWLARAEVQRARLKAPGEALASLRAALAIDPSNAGARDAMRAQFEALGEPTALRDGLVELASTGPTPDRRASDLVRAAEIDEHVLQDDDHAAQLYARAMEQLPGDRGIDVRRLRVLQRRARRGAAQTSELREALQSRLDREPSRPEHALDLVLALTGQDGEAARATTLIDGLLSRDPSAPHAVRLLEHVARVTRAAPLLANALAQQADAFQAEAPRLGALWAEEELVEWALPSSDPTAILDRILQLVPSDRAALDSSVRLSLPLARAGDGTARSRLTTAFGARLAQAADDTERLYHHLALALVLAGGPGERQDEARAALGHYREALRIDPLSVTAAEGAARLGALLGDADATVTAALAHADLAVEGRQRAVFFVQAAGQILSSKDALLGGRPERLARAGEILERALDADPEGLPAVGLLVAVRGEDGRRELLLAALRGAFERATSRDVVVQLGGEVARIAAQSPPDHVLAISALRRVLSVAPGSVATLRALADQHLAQAAWGEAVETLEDLAKQVRDAGSRLHALMQLAELYTTTLGRPADAERVLRSALDADPASLEALRRLVVLRSAQGADAAEIAGLLDRAADVESDPAAKAVALTQLADLRLRSGDMGAAEQALVEATAQATTPERIARLVALHPSSAAEQARLLAAVVSRGEELERPEPACLAALGQLEVGLGRWPEGVAHLRVALGLAPGLHEARAALAAGLARSRATAEAIHVLLPMMVPDPSPLLSLRDPAGALGALEAALDAEGRHDEALVARELRAIAGGLDDGAHVELRARRLAIDPSAPIPVVLDATALRKGVVPPDAPGLLLDLAAALSGAEGKLASVSLEDLGVGARDRLLPGGGHPVLRTVHRLSTMLGIPRPEVALSSSVPHARVLMKDDPWLVVPEALAEQPEPAQVAALTRPLVRIALAVTWLDDLPGPYAHAVLCGAARQVEPGFASELAADDQADLVAELTRRVGRAIGRRQKKVLAELAPMLSGLLAPTLADAAAFERAIARTELRVAFVMTGDLLATLDSARALDADLARATAEVGPRALGAMLRHPLGGDLAAFGLSPAATALRWRAGTLWRRG